MSDRTSESSGVFRHRFSVPEEVIDRNGHVNNVAFVQWMQDVAIRHSTAAGGLEAMREAGGSWVVRSHWIEYLSPAFVGDTIEAATWVANFQRVRSLRQYRFTRVADGKLLAQGETDWVFVNAATGRPCSIPDSVKACYRLPPSDGHQFHDRNQ